MEDIKKHPLLDKQYDVSFIHAKHGKVTMSAGLNPLNTSWMWWFSISNAMYAGSKHDVNDILKGIRAKAKILNDTFWK